MAVYVCDSLQYEVIMNHQNGLELILVALCRQRMPNQKVHLGVWYRPPCDNLAIESLHNVLENLEPNIFNNFYITW